MTEHDGKPRQRRKEARPEEIRRAALEELAEKGIAGSTLGGIARRAGISRTTVYLYFETKQDIFEAVARDTVERTIDDAASMMAGFEGPFEQIFTNVIDRIYGQLVDGDASVILRALVSEGREQSEIVEFYHREIFAKGEATMRKMIAMGVARGELVSSAAEIDPRILMSPAIFAGIWSLVFGNIEAIDLERFKRDHVSLVLHGILKSG